MNKFLKALILASLLYIFHIIIGVFLSLTFTQEPAYISYGILASAIYIIIVAFWAYYLFSLIYLVIVNLKHSISFKLIVAFLLMMIAYVLFRTGDIIDGDFIERFQWMPLLVFVASSAFIVVVDSLIWRKKENSKV